jgi:hypothetical protein
MQESQHELTMNRQVAYSVSLSVVEGSARSDFAGTPEKTIVSADPSSRVEGTRADSFAARLAG